MSYEARLKELGIVLPESPAAAGNYVPFTQEGNLLVISGQVPRNLDGSLGCIGKLGDSYTVEQGIEAARNCALQGLTVMKSALGNLDRIKRILRLGGFVNCTHDFAQQPQVINGASDLILAVFGDAGLHARAAVGCSALPGGVAVEVEFLVAVVP